MATNQYNLIPDFIAYQVLLFADMNRFNENLKYFHDDLFGAPASNSDFVKYIKLGLNSADGGNMFFNAGTSEYLLCDTENELFVLQGMHFKIKSPYRIKGGDRVLYSSSAGGASAVDCFTLDGNPQGHAGFVMPYDGSVQYLGMTVKTSSFTSSGEAQPRLQKNGSDWLFTNGVSITANSTKYMVPAAGFTGAMSLKTDATFVAGDYISPRYIKVSGTFTLFPCIDFGVIFDD
jgi:hypothetical protein